MDINRLPAIRTTQLTNAHAADSVRGPHKVSEYRPETANPGRPGRVDRVLQGELLAGQREMFTSTHSFLDQRVFEQAQSAQQLPVSSRGAPAALGRYLDHVSPEPSDSYTHGKSVDFFV